MSDRISVAKVDGVWTLSLPGVREPYRYQFTSWAAAYAAADRGASLAATLLGVCRPVRGAAVTTLTAAPSVELAPAPSPAMGESRCQMEWAYLPGLTWDRCELPAAVDAIVACGRGCGDRVRSWCAPCSADATASPTDLLVCTVCDARGAVIVAVHHR